MFCFRMKWRVVIGPFVSFVLIVHFCKKVNIKKNTNWCRKFCLTPKVKTALGTEKSPRIHTMPALHSGANMQPPPTLTPTTHPGNIGHTLQSPVRANFCFTQPLLSHFFPFKQLYWDVIYIPNNSPIQWLLEYYKFLKIVVNMYITLKWLF